MEIIATAFPSPFFVKIYPSFRPTVFNSFGKHLSDGPFIKK